MRIDATELVRDALACSASHAAVIDTRAIIFDEAFRKACERNACGKYNTNWMGPPAIGPIQELMQKVRKFRRGLLFQTVHTISSSFDMKGMIEGAKVHERVFRDLLKTIRRKYAFGKMLALNAGCCRVCERCAFLDNEPCRHPDEAVSSVEAYGIDAMALQKQAGIPYYSGKNTVTYVGLILFSA
jgi:predicted metal-binding protein